MTDKEKLDAIRAEIERRIAKRRSEIKKYCGSLIDKEKLQEDLELLSLIDSLEEPVSEELEEAAKNHAVERFRTTRNRELAEKCKWSYITGAHWQKENLWKPADGDDLPDVGREVIALVGLEGFFKIPPDEPVKLSYKVVFAHRPPDYLDGKDIVTGKVTRNYPKTYDKGGWNIPNVKYWLDCQIPNMGED